jgi:hypothetical protein
MKDVVPTYRGVWLRPVLVSKKIISYEIRFRFGSASPQHCRIQEDRWPPELRMPRQTTSATLGTADSSRTYDVDSDHRTHCRSLWLVLVHSSTISLEAKESSAQVSPNRLLRNVTFQVLLRVASL